MWGCVKDLARANSEWLFFPKNQKSEVRSFSEADGERLKGRMRCGTAARCSPKGLSTLAKCLIRIVGRVKAPSIREEAKKKKKSDVF